MQLNFGLEPPEVNLDNPIFVYYVNTNGLSRQRADEMLGQLSSMFSYKNTHTYEEMKVYLSKLRWRVVSKSYARWSINEPNVSGFYIDMESIYGDVEKRNRRIDIVLGLMKDDKYVPTIGDLYPNLK